MPTLEDQSLTQPNSSAMATQSQLLQDVASLDVKSLFNRGVYSFVILWAYYMGGVDEMIFRGNEADWEASLKTTGVFMVTNELGAMVRRQFPQLIL